MNDTQIFVACVIVVLLTIKKTFGFAMLAFFGFMLNGKKFDREISLLTFYAVCRMLVQGVVIYFAIAHMPSSII